jgi:hypothetical protein
LNCLAEEKDGSAASVGIAVGQITGSGALLEQKTYPYFSLGLRSSGVGEPGYFRYMYKAWLASSEAVAGKNQTSFAHQAHLYLFDLGYGTGVCYITGLVNVCPEVVIESKGLTSSANAFHFLGFGIGLELAKSLETSEIFVEYRNVSFSQRINHNREVGGTSTLMFGSRLILK